MLSADPTPIANDISRAPTDPLIRRTDTTDDLADGEALWLEGYNTCREWMLRVLRKRPGITIDELARLCPERRSM
jgi:hypothetical protein